jgi:hypothetical protein
MLAWAALLSPGQSSPRSLLQPVNFPWSSLAPELLQRPIEGMEEGVGKTDKSYSQVKETRPPRKSHMPYAWTGH